MWVPLTFFFLYTIPHYFPRLSVALFWRDVALKCCSGHKFPHCTVHWGSNPFDVSECWAPAMTDFIPFSPLPPSLDYGFLDFLQIFLLGDFTNLLTIAPKGVSSLGVNDSVKTTMFLQVLLTALLPLGSLLGRPGSLRPKPFFGKAVARLKSLQNLEAFFELFWVLLTKKIVIF